MAIISISPLGKIMESVVRRATIHLCQNIMPVIVKENVRRYDMTTLSMALPHPILRHSQFLKAIVPQRYNPCSFS